MSEHRFAMEHLPWLANGTLVGGEKERVERHLGECLICQQEWRAQQHIAAAVGAPSLTSAPDEAFAALNARLGPEAAAPGGPLAWLARLARDTPVPVRVAVAAQFVAVVGLVAALLATQPPEMTGPFQTRAASEPVAGDARVVFSPDASVAQIEALLTRHEARVVDGPTQRGVYTLSLAAGAGPVALSALRQEDIVVFAERPASVVRERRR